LQNIRRVDGSGLSRYNLVSPQVLATALEKLYQQQPMDRIQKLFPAGEQSGTLKDWFGNGENPAYVYAKTGSMSGVYCLAGYLKTKKGKTLVFSFMSNNFIGSNRVIKEELQVILEYIRDKM
jgi:D-alanyl-D-alanine carboxypeptidase/D-alanyl-D-alanine-endopeptidase (penicillin-binding protein 4)